MEIDSIAPTSKTHVLHETPIMMSQPRVRMGEVVVFLLCRARFMSKSERVEVVLLQFTAFGRQPQVIFDMRYHLALCLMLLFDLRLTDYTWTVKQTYL